MVWGIFSRHTLGSPIPVKDCLNTTASLSVVAVHVRLLVTVMAASRRILHYVTKLGSSQTGFLNTTMSLLYSNGLHRYQSSIQ